MWPSQIHELNCHQVIFFFFFLFLHLTCLTPYEQLGWCCSKKKNKGAFPTSTFGPYNMFLISYSFMLQFLSAFFYLISVKNSISWSSVLPDNKNPIPRMHSKHG